MFYDSINIDGEIFKVGDKVWALDGGNRYKTIIVNIFDDYDETDGKACYVETPRNSGKWHCSLNEIYYEEYDAIMAERRCDSKYDGYVTT